jgi:hypothetical protein
MLSTAPREAHGCYSEAKFIGCRYSTYKACLCSLARQSLPCRESPKLSRYQHEHPCKERCLRLQGNPMDDIQRQSSLVAGKARAKHLNAPWQGNRCHVEKVLNFPDTSMSIHVKSVVYGSRGTPWMIFRGQVHSLQI